MSGDATNEIYNCFSSRDEINVIFLTKIGIFFSFYVHIYSKKYQGLCCAVSGPMRASKVRTDRFCLLFVFLISPMSEGGAFNVRNGVMLA